MYPSQDTSLSDEGRDFGEHERSDGNHQRDAKSYCDVTNCLASLVTDVENVNQL